MTDGGPGPFFLAVGGGKGGVGKSFVAANLALACARRGARAGLRVAAVDLDVGGANLNLFLGEVVPQRELADFFDGRADSLNAVAQPTRLPNLRYVAGSFDLITAVDPLRARKLDLVAALVGLEADVVVLDLPAGSAPATLDFFFLGDAKIIVTNSEAIAIHNAYGFLKNYLLRRLLTDFRDRPEVQRFILDHYRAERDGPATGDRTITALLPAFRKAFPAVAPEAEAILDEEAPWLLVNRARLPQDAERAERFRVVCERNLSLRCGVLGTIPEDRRVAHAVRNAQPFVLTHPQHPITRQFSAWAGQLLAGRAR